MNIQAIEENHPGIGAALVSLITQVEEHFPGVRLTIIARDPDSNTSKVGSCVASGDEDMDAVASIVVEIAGMERGPTQ